MIIELLPHFDAGDKAFWHGDQDERPLSLLGRSQAMDVAASLMAGGEIDALFSSPALRCYESLAPLSDRLGIEVQVLDTLAEKGADEDLAEMIQRGLIAIEQIREELPEGRAVACSHGDIIPATIDVLRGMYGISAPSLERRGQWYTIEFDGDEVSVQLREAG